MGGIFPISILSGRLRNGVRNMAFLAAIMIDRESPRESTDWPQFWQGRPEIAGRHPSFPHGRHRDPNRG